MDLLIVETAFDTLNLKAALFAIDAFFEERGVRLPVMVSGTIVDESGRTMTGQTIEAFWTSIRFGISVTSRMLPKDFRIFRRPLNVVAIPAPIFLSMSRKQMSKAPTISRRTSGNLPFVLS